ncbi:MAG: PilN domain-containing protein [Chromatiales bacterium]
MAHINLLPWREELRRLQRRNFLSILGLSLVLAAGVVGLVQWYFNQRIEYQGSRNARLEGEIATLNQKIEEIRTLEREKERLVKRIEAIQTLETNRPLEVRLFDEIVNTLPEGVFLQEIDQKGTAITVKGVAQSQSRVSSFMRNVEASRWVTNPRLEVVQTVTEEGERLSQFTLMVEQVIPKKEGEEEGDSAAEPVAAAQGGTS